MVGFITILALILVAGGAMASGRLTRDISGTMEYVDLEDGFWAVASDGDRFIPLNLSEEHMVEGLKVRVKVVEQSEMMGIHMAGTYVEIIK